MVTQQNLDLLFQVRVLAGQFGLVMGFAVNCPGRADDSYSKRVNGFMHKIILIGLGGALGTIARYFVSRIDYRFSGGVFPVSTLVVNVSGSLVIGFLWGLFERVSVPLNIRLFFLIGILGGYTTFSTFALSNLNLLRDGQIKIAFVNIAATNGLGLVAIFLGFSLARVFLKML